MTPESIQTRLQLQAMRPNGRDEHDPVLAQARQHAAADPALGDWFAREQAFDSAFAASLATLRPPASLHATILAGAHATRRASRWRRTAGAGLAAAAVIVLMAGISGLWLRPVPQAGDPLAEFRASMIHTLEDRHSLDGLDHQTPQADDARVWLASHQGIANPAIPPGLCSRETIGCKVFEWNGAKVTLICFRPCPSGNPQSASAHLFVVDEKDAPALLTAAADDPHFAETNAWTSAVWKKEGKFHLLVSRSALPHMQSLFAFDR